ncbi:MAG: hypothetical protein H7222_15410 [Methylotenera sp.]|nr:hypothetical protein [Oligoflexia bacterium]
MKNENTSYLSLTNLAIVAVGGFIVWKSRFKIQKGLESIGIDTPWMTGSAGEAIQSGIAKISGSIENDVSSITRPSTRSAI